MPYRTSKTKLQEMERMYLDGRSYQDIANSYGVTRQRIHQLFQKYDLASEIRGMVRCAYCREYFQYGKAEEHGATHPENLKTMGVTGMGQSMESSLMDEDIARDYQSGMRVADISRKYPVNGHPRTYTDIYRRIRRRGIMPNRGGGRYVRDDLQRARFRESFYGDAKPHHTWRASDEG